MASISYFLYMVVRFVEANKDKPNPEHPPDEVAQVALGLYVSQAYYLLVYLYLIVISVMLVVGVHTVSFSSSFSFFFRKKFSNYLP